MAQKAFGCRGRLNGSLKGGLSIEDLDVGADGSVGLNVPATGNAKFFKVTVPDK